MDVTSLLLIYAGVILAVATYTDLRWREVPDWLNYAGIAAGVSTRLFAFLTTLDWQWIIAGAFGIAAAFGLSWIMFHAGQWGGGDAKLLITLGVILGVAWSVQSPGVAFVVNLLIAGAAYGILWTLATAITHRQACARELMALSRKGSIRMIRTVSLVVAAALMITALFLPAQIRLPLIIFAVMLPTLLSLGIVIKAVEQGCMLKSVHPSKLTEGDWIVKDVIVGGKRITGPADLGVSMPQIRTLRKLASKNRIKQVLIKEGMPFVPSFTLAFILLVALGNVLVWLVG
jgi:Flp pilus assembly protein protease CpaA